MRQLREAGCGLRARNARGRTALQCATEAGHAEVAEYLAIVTADLG